MEKNRLEAFSDGVLAIIITVMILELKQPAGAALSDFLALTPTLLAYLLSFMFIAIYWVNHHLMFQQAEKINKRFVIWLIYGLGMLVMTVLAIIRLFAEMKVGKA